MSYKVKVKSGFLMVRKQVRRNNYHVAWPECHCETHWWGQILFQALVARKDAYMLSGDILTNEASQSASFKCDSGYMVQYDGMMVPRLTENLQFLSAGWIKKVTEK
jgi:ATP-binding cassette subfamily G (WHITE) protein 2